MVRKDPGWRKASYSNGSGNCVEVGHLAGHVAVRDTKQHGQGPELAFPPKAWRTFARQIKTQGLFLWLRAPPHHRRGRGTWACTRR